MCRSSELGKMESDWISRVREISILESFSSDDEDDDENDTALCECDQKDALTQEGLLLLCLHLSDSYNVKPATSFAFEPQQLGLTSLEEVLLQHRSTITIQRYTRGFYVRKAISISFQEYVRHEAACIMQNAYRSYSTKLISLHCRPAIKQNKISDASFPPQRQFTDEETGILSVGNIFFVSRDHSSFAQRYLNCGLYHFFQSYCVRQKRSALLNQRYTRDMMSRRKLKKSNFLPKSVVRSVVVLQSHVRSRPERRRFLTFREAALRLQSCNRRKQAQNLLAIQQFEASIKKLFSTKFLADTAKDAQWEEKKEEEACVCIQRALCKRPQQELETHRTVVAATQIQSFWRSFVHHRRFKTQRSAVLVLQRFMKDYQTKRSNHSMMQKVVYLHARSQSWIFSSTINHKSPLRLEDWERSRSPFLSNEMIYEDNQEDGSSDPGSTLAQPPKLSTSSISDLSAILAQPLDDLVVDILGTDTEFQRANISGRHSPQRTQIYNDDDDMEDEINHNQAVLAIQLESQSLEQLFELMDH